MTLTSTTVRVQYDGDGSTVAFPVTFVFWDSDDLQVVHTDSSGTETTWTRGTQYTVSGGNGSTGTVTASTSPTDYTPAMGETLTIISNLSDTQDTTLPEGGSLDTSALEQQLDKIVRQNQQRTNTTDRSLRQPASDADNIDTIPAKAARASKFLAFDSNGDPTASSGTTDSPISTAMEAVVGAGSLADGRTELDVYSQAEVDAIGDAKIKQGKHSVWIPAAAMRPTYSNGCAILTDVETTAGRPDLQVLDFDASADEHAQFQIAFPKSWDEGTILFQVFWTTTATDTDGVAWGLQGVACGDGDTADQAYGTAVVVTDAVQSTAEDIYVTSWSSAVTIGNTPNDGNICFFRLFRDVSDGADTMAEDGRLLGVLIRYDVNLGDDD